MFSESYDAVEIQHQGNKDGEIISGEMPDWGISLSSSDVTPAGMTLICSQSGGDITGMLMTGPQYYLEIQTDSGWETLQAKDGINIWHLSAYSIPLNESTECKLNWSSRYGELAPGIYRLYKPIWEGVTMQNGLRYAYSHEFIIGIMDEDNTPLEIMG